MSDAEAERTWRGLRVRGEQDAALFPIRKHYQALRIKLDAFLVKKMLTPKQWGEVQYLQGQIRGIADVILQVNRLSEPETTKQTRARPEA